MANLFGYNQQFADKPEMWDVDGYAVVSDTDGTLVLELNVLNANTGALTPTQFASPSGPVNDITQTSAGSGIYKIHLKENFVQLVHASIHTVIPTGSPAAASVQINESTVGNANYGPGLSELQYVKFTTVDFAGSAVKLNASSAVVFRLRLKRSSA